MLRKTEVYTNITPIPSHVPRQLAIDILHSHGEIITLNPLVLEHRPIKAPRNADATEYYSTWYEITERIQYVPGMGKIGAGKISFNGCFHDMPWGIQTHIYAPMGVDLKNKWQIAGNQPGEPPQPRELGINAPADGLYLREDIEIRCNVTLVSFVKNQMKASSKILVDRLIKKAELLEAGELLAMMENGKLKTINPADRSSQNLSLRHQSLRSPPVSPGLAYQVPLPPSPDPQTVNHPRVELPGDFYHPQPSPSFAQAQPSPKFAPAQPSPSFQSQAFPAAQHSPSFPSQAFPSPHLAPSEHSVNPSPEIDKGRWSDYQSSAGSRPTSYASDASGFRASVPVDQKNYTAYATGLIPVGETHEEHDSAVSVSRGNSAKQPALGLAPGTTGQPPTYKYNPQDFARV